MEHRIERLEELAIALNAEIEKAAAALPEIKAELQAFLAGRVAELAAVAKGDAKADVRAQCEAIRFEVAGRIDTHMAAIMAKRQEVCQLAEIEPALKSFAERAAAGVLREFAKENDTKLESIRHEFAKAPKFKHEFAVGGAALADAMKGNWDKDTTYKRGDIFTFRGSSYLVMRESRGVLPTQQEQKGPSPRYAVIAASGSPGSNGANGLSAQSVGITSSSLTMNTNRILGRTTAGSGAIQEISVGGNLTFASGALGTSNNPTVTGTNTAGVFATPPSSGTAYGRMIADPARADNFFFGANFNGGSQDDASKPSWYATLDCRTAGDQYAVVRIAPGGSPETAFAVTTAGTSVCNNVATPAGGSTAARLVFGTTAGFGIYYGSGAPTVSAAQGSLYIRSDGSSTSTRLYVNTNGTTGWTNFTSAA